MNSEQKPATPRWVALVNDRIFTAPRQKLPVALLRALSSVPQDHALVRDHQSPNDEVLDSSASIDLGNGNVFYTRPHSEVTGHGPCQSPAKMALVVDDAFEIIEIQELPVEAMLSLFDLPADAVLVRDYESPHDQPIPPGALVRFVDGPTFLSHGKKPHHIDVAIVTTAGSFPEEGFERLPINQPVKVQLARAVAALKIKEVADWVATVGTRELDITKSYADNSLSGCVAITYGKPAGGGGASR